MIIAPMQSLSLQSPPHPWLTRLVTFMLAALAAASVGYWALKWPAPKPTARAVPAEPASPPIDTAKVAQLLGAKAGLPTAPVAAAARYKLLGVIAQGPHSGSALIATDGKPAKPYRVGERVTDDLLLHGVKARSVTLAADAQGAGAVTLELPPLSGTP